MEGRIPKKGEVYRHFKGNLYEIVILARDSETLEEKVVYKEVDGEAAYVRPLAMFLSPVDRMKYPNASQELRFERVEEVKPTEEVIPDSALLMPYFELITTEEKLNYLLRVKDDITENFLQVVAQSMDFTEQEGSLAERYDAILKYLRTLSRFESGRLR
ncbi:MAG: DUF1653 domain-containing protein [Faecalimonas sp.]|nr:DUF1653 domain-containing protein [Faecalimonas sp.]